MKNLKYKTHSKTAPVANDVMKNGILLGCHQGLTYKELKYMCNTFLKFAKLKKL
jgi:CDP-6-deoxy-D-xylo-4-hexulose-3-dehydrase